MIGKRSCIAMLLTMLITLTAGATAYDATSVKMCTSAGDISMVKIGMTADSCGIWFCRNIDKDASRVRWKIDDMVYVTFPTKKFVTSTLYQLANYTDLLNYDRAIVGDTTVYVYFRAKSQEYAQCFLWDGKTTPDFASQFQIAGSINADVTDAYHGEGCYIHSLKYQISGMSEEVFDHLTIERSYDGGTTWNTVNGYITDMNAVLPIMLSMDKMTVRYRIKAYVKDVYQVAWNENTWTYETSDYHITPADMPIYKASKVVMWTGYRPVFSIPYSHLGTTKDNYQIWGNQGESNVNKTHWNVDDGEDLSVSLDNIRPYTIYLDLDNDYASGNDKFIVKGTQWYHFAKVYSKSSIDYFTWNPTDEIHDRFHPYSFYLYADFALSGKDITVNHDTHTLQREMSYEVRCIDGKVLDSLALYASCDQGQTWKQISALTTGFSEGTKDFSKSELVNLPGNGTTIRYRVVAYAKDAYKVLSEDGTWVYETTDSPLTVAEASSASSITVNPIDRDTYSNTEGSPRGTYRTNISYHMLSEIADQVDSVQIQCSNDHGKTWSTIVTTTNTKGTETVYVPAGYASYQLRAVPFLKGDLANVPLLSQPVTATEQTLTYSPAVTSLTAEDAGTVEGYGKTLHACTVRYELNDDLYQTRREASIAYSYDDGQHWYNLPSFTPNPSGEQTVKMDGSQKQCRFRIKVESVYDNETCYTAETQNITFE